MRNPDAQARALELKAGGMEKPMDVWTQLRKEGHEVKYQTAWGWLNR